MLNATKSEIDTFDQPIKMNKKKEYPACRCHITEMTTMNAKIVMHHKAATDLMINTIDQPSTTTLCFR
uniref:Uncharacterized protein n=1 Tax=Romanomermis culicivorax TaxID=13658 RepID=A0A915KBP5_ROMCU